MTVRMKQVQGEKTSTVNDIQIGGDHYRSQYQHWDWVRDYCDNDYLIGQITKYLARWRKKNGLQDLEKAAHYAEKRLEVARTSVPPRYANIKDIGAGTAHFCATNDLDIWTTTAIWLVVTAVDPAGLELALDFIRDGIERFRTEPLSNLNAG